MSNAYGISKMDEEDVRARDVFCVYCHKEMENYPFSAGTRADWATIEHLNNDGPFDAKSNIAICCSRCNSSRGNKKIRTWFGTRYCLEKNINGASVAEPVKIYLCTNEILDR